MSARSRPARGAAARATPVEGIPPRARDREVLDTAAEVFARSGYAGSTVQDVADALGILKGSLYYYIKTKEDLLFRLLEEIHVDGVQMLQDVQAREGLNAIERLQEYVRMQTRYNLRNLVKISVYYNDIDQLGEERRREIIRRRKDHEDYVAGLIKAAQDEGHVSRDREARLLANSVFAVVIWPYRWFRPRGRFKADEVVESCVEFVTLALTGR
jgi:AcrR family transcriptional regulator